ncbi:Uncharacterised protein [uncultured archaeon]|nr:Uncharacterised protein [uncultured archaeon]
MNYSKYIIMNTMKKFPLILCILGTLAFAQQTKIDPTFQISWPKLVGTSAPLSPQPSVKPPHLCGGYKRV